VDYKQGRGLTAHETHQRTRKLIRLSCLFAYFVVDLPRVDGLSLLDLPFSTSVLLAKKAEFTDEPPHRPGICLVLVKMVPLETQDLIHRD
jgi:hypothetical protein